MTDAACTLPLLVWGMPGGSEMLVILLIGLLVFGGKLPEVARNIARGLNEFKKGIADLDRDVRQPVERAMRLEAPDESVPYQPPRAEPDPETAISCDDNDSSESAVMSPDTPRG